MLPQAKSSGDAGDRVSPVNNTSAAVWIDLRSSTVRTILDRCCLCKRSIEGDRIMNIVLWVVQALLALVFFYSGGKKLIRSNEQIQALPWARDLSRAMVRAIGILEVLGAIGVILPVLTGILPWLTPLAAGGLAVLMLGATWINRTQVLFGDGCIHDGKAVWNVRHTQSSR
jgi:uncharacterized membrane protein YphA (DoxX/SURF4 family)